ncbi:MAG: acyltransferase [Desulfobacula sp.]|nr:acyltransferase [Desulfobacula sp.]
MNFEIQKLFIENPNKINLFLFMLFVFVSILTFNRENHTTFLDLHQTDQIKGIAIILIVIGHLWVHVTTQKAAIVLSGEGVSLFLILSGFGLTRSNIANSYSVKSFFFKRISKLFAAYWIATVVILILDFFLLDRTYSLKDICLTFMGINISETTKHIDYVRWFITFIILWYLIFILSAKVRYGRYFLPIIFVSSCFIFVFDYYVSHFGWYQIFSFFTGCFLGFYYNPIKTIVIKNINIIGFAGLLGIITALLMNLYISDLLKEYLPYIFTLFLEEAKSIVFSLSIISVVFFVGTCGVISHFLNLVGKISYEFFLIHGAFLIKYNFFFGKNDFHISLFILYFCILIFASLILHHMAARMNFASIFQHYYSKK